MLNDSFGAVDRTVADEVKVLVLIGETSNVNPVTYVTLGPVASRHTEVAKCSPGARMQTRRKTERVQRLGKERFEVWKRERTWQCRVDTMPFRGDGDILEYLTTAFLMISGRR